MTFNEMQTAIRDAKQTLRNGDEAARQLAHLLAGRLQVSGVDHGVLCKLKRELARYDMHRRTWKP